MLKMYIPDFTKNVEGFFIGTRNPYFDADRAILSHLTPCPNLTDLHLSIAQTTGYMVPLDLIPRLFPNLKKLDIPAAEPFVGSLHSLSGLEQLHLRNSCWPNDALMPYASIPTLTGIDFLGSWFDPPAIRRLFPTALNRFSNLKFLTIYSLVEGSEALFNTDSYELETLRVALEVRYDKYSGEIFTQRALSDLQDLEISVCVGGYQHVEGMPAQQAWDDIISQITSSIPSLKRLALLGVPLNPSWVRHLGNLNHLTFVLLMVEGRASLSNLSDKNRLLNEEKYRESFYKAFEDVHFENAPEIVVHVAWAM